MTTTATANLRTGIRMSLDDFLALGETDGRWELDDGVLYIMSSGTPDHQFLMGRFMWNFQNYLEQFDTPPAQFFHEMTTILSRELQRAPEPDLVIILNESREIVGPVRVEGAPDIISRNPVHRPRPRFELQAADLRRSRRPRILAHRPPQRHPNPPPATKRRIHRASHPRPRRHPNHPPPPRPIHTPNRHIPPPPSPHPPRVNPVSLLSCQFPPPPGELGSPVPQSPPPPGEG